jgi:hypothetical protein
MTPRYNPDDGQWHWYSEDTGWGDVLSDADIAAAKGANQIPDTSAEADQAITDALAGLGVTKTFRAEHAKEWNEYQQWNTHQKDTKGRTLTETQAEEAYGYLTTGAVKTMAAALDYYTQYLTDPSLPSPWQVGQWLKAQPPPLVAPGAVDWGLGREQAGLPAAGPTTGLPPGAEGTPVGQAILAVTNDPAVQATMWAGAGLEGSTVGPWGTKPGDSEVGGAGEVGPWQINPIHFGPEIDAAGAADPNVAARYMLADYQNGVASVPADLWKTDPQRAMALAVANSERPGGWHEGLTADEALAIYTPERVASATGGATPGTPVGGGFHAGPAAAVAPSTRVLTQAETDEAAVLNQIYGLPVGIYKAAKDQGLTSADDIVAYWRSIQSGKTLETERLVMESLQAQGILKTAWTDDDLAQAVLLDLQDTDLAAAATAGQTPRVWFDAQMQGAADFAKSQGLTTQQLGQALLNKQTIPEYKTMTELKMSFPQYTAAEQTLGKDPEDIWAAKQLGYDPATMTPGQVQQFQVKTSLDVGQTVLWDQVPEAIKPELGALNQAQIQNEYDAAKAQARVQGKFLAPQEFLQSQYPGVFGGGTRQELQADLEKLGAYEAPPTVSGNAEWGIPPHALSPFYRLAPLGVLGAMFKPTMQTNTGVPYGAYAAGLASTGVMGIQNLEKGRTGRTLQNLINYERGIATGQGGEYPKSAEMVATRAMAEAMLKAPGPIGTQTPEEAAARKAAISTQYPALSKAVSPPAATAMPLVQGANVQLTAPAVGTLADLSQWPRKKKKLPPELGTTPIAGAVTGGGVTLGGVTLGGVASNKGLG